MMEGCAKKTSQTSTDASEMTLKKISVADRETAKRKAVFSKTSKEEMKNAGSEAWRGIKEKLEESTARKPSGDTTESCKNTDKKVGKETGEGRRNSSRDVPAQQTGYMHKENKRKRPSSMSENSQEDRCPNENVVTEMRHKRQQLTSAQDTSCDEPRNLPSSGKKEVTAADEGESDKPSRKRAMDKGM